MINQNDFVVLYALLVLTVSLFILFGGGRKGD